MDLIRHVPVLFRRRLTRNFLSLAVCQILSALLGLGATVYLARVLGLSAFGTFALAQAVVAYLVLCTDLGIHIVGINAVAAKPSRARFYTGTLVSLRLVLALGVYAAYAGVLLALPRPGPWKAAMAVFGASLFPFVFYIDWVFRGLQRMGAIGLALVAKTGVFFVLVAVFVHSPDDLLIAAVCWAAAIATMSAVLWIVFLGKIGPVPPLIRPRLWKRTLIKAVPLGLSFITLLLYQHLNILLIGILRPGGAADQEMALYNASFRIILFFVFIASAYLFALHPSLVEAREQKGALEIVRQRLKGGLTFCLALAAPAVVSGFCFAEDILPFVYGSDFAPSAEVFRIMIWQVLAVFAGVSFSAALLAYGRGKSFLLAVVAGLTVHLILSLLLIPDHGLTGAAWAILMAEIVIQAGVIVLAFRSVTAFNPLRPILLTGLSTAAMAAVLIFLDLHFLLEIGIGCAVYLAVFAALEKGRRMITAHQP